jgi:heptosyltransferase-2
MRRRKSGARDWGLEKLTVDKPARKKKILVLRYRFIGDTILTIPFLRNLRRAEPSAYIAWVVAPGSSEVIKGIPYVDELIYWDPLTIHADSRGTHRTWKEKWGFIRELRARHFDKVYVLKRSFSSAIMALISGAPARIGFATEGRGLLLTKRVPYRHDRHEVLNFLEVLKSDGMVIHDDFLEYWTTLEEERIADDLLDREGVMATDKIVAIHPFSSISARGWHLENYASLVSRLHKEGYRTMILGAPGDKVVFDGMRHLFGPLCADLVGKADIRITMALLRKSSLFVGNDSGVMHLAAAAGIPLVVLFGPQSPIKFRPWSTHARIMYKNFPCSPCRQKFFTECEPSPRMRPACMEAVTVDEVFRECVDILRERVKSD